MKHNRSLGKHLHTLATVRSTIYYINHRVHRELNKSHTAVDAFSVVLFIFKDKNILQWMMIRVIKSKVLQRTHLIEKYWTFSKRFVSLCL